MKPVSRPQLPLLSLTFQCANEAARLYFEPLRNHLRVFMVWLAILVTVALISWQSVPLESFASRQFDMLTSDDFTGAALFFLGGIAVGVCVLKWRPPQDRHLSAWGLAQRLVEQEEDGLRRIEEAYKAILLRSPTADEARTDWNSIVAKPRQTEISVWHTFCRTLMKRHNVAVIPIIVPAPPRPSRPLLVCGTVCGMVLIVWGVHVSTHPVQAGVLAVVAVPAIGAAGVVGAIGAYSSKS
jgi:hypothetical protein